MNVKVVSRKLIKPCTPTPQNLKHHKLSFLDEFAAPINVGVILIYPTSNSEQISHLEESLAKILPKFYPLAGRYIKNDHYVDCDDQGAEFVQAEAVADLADLMANIGNDQLNGLLPRGLFQVDLESPTDPLLSIQITELKNRGALVIGVTISHKIFDAFSLGTFISAWSSGCPDCPTFDSPELFPRNQGYCPEANLLTGAIAHYRLSNPVVKRFTFNNEAIAAIRSKLSSPNHYSRVRVVTAVIARALMGVDRTKHGRSRATIIAQAINMRGRMGPASPGPTPSCGNLSMTAYTRCNFADNIGIQELVDIIGDSIERAVADCGRILSPGVDKYGMIVDPIRDGLKELASGEVNGIFVSDWSKFGFYQADFGEGKPVGIGAMVAENTVVLTENKEGNGIEAWLNLDGNDVVYFEQDKEIQKLLFTA